MKEKQIGWFTLKEDKVFTNTYETAAWYENVKVPAGRYPIVVYNYQVMHFEDEARQRFNGEVNGFIGSVYVPMDGVITDDYFGTLFFGNPVGTYDGSKNAGKPSHHNKHVYMYDVADSVLNDPDTPYELLPEYEAREQHGEYNGEEYVTHAIFLKEV